MSPKGVYDRQPRRYTPALVDEIRSRYQDAGQTQREIAAALGTSQSCIRLVMRAHGIAVRSAGAPKGLLAGPSNPGWKGDSASYSAFHHRVTAAKGQPQQCSNCGTSDPSLSYDWANLTGDYANLDDYARMCRPCHRNYDNNRQENQPA